MYRSALETAGGEVEVVAVYDDDDDTIERYPEGPTYVMSPHGMNQSAMWSLAWENASGDIAHMSADDLIYRTPGWDAFVAQAFMRWREPLGMVYVNDLYGLSATSFLGQRSSETQDNGKYCFAANPFVTRQWIEALDGFFTPPFYKSWEADTWIYLLAEAITRATYLHGVVIEHLHPMTGKAEMDETYARGAWGDKRMRTEGWRRTRSREMRALREEQVRKLTDAIQTHRRAGADAI